MRLLGFAVLSGLAAFAAGDAVNDLEAKGRLQINDYMANGTGKACTKDKLQVRREWCVFPWVLERCSANL